MTDIRYKRSKSAILMAAAGSLVFALNGCGGTSTGKSLLPTPASGPVVYGLQGTGAVSALPLEASGLGSPDSKIAYITAATDSTAKPIPAIAVTNPNRPSEKTIGLGFAPWSQYIDAVTYGEAVLPGTSVIFRAAISNGIDPTTEKVLPIVPSSVILTSPELPSFSAKVLTFTSDTTGPLANGTYTTAPFTLPFTTTGLHSLKVSVSDTKPQSSNTTFKVAVIKSTDTVILAQIQDVDGNAITGAVATVTGGLPGAYVGPGQTKPADPTASVSDAQGMIVLFATPIAGGNTVTVTKGSDTTSDTEVLTAGKVFNMFDDPTFEPPDPQTVPPTLPDKVPYYLTLGS